MLESSMESDGDVFVVVLGGFGMPPRTRNVLVRLRSTQAFFFECRGNSRTIGGDPLGFTMKLYAGGLTTWA